MVPFDGLDLQSVLNFVILAVDLGKTWMHSRVTAIEMRFPSGVKLGIFVFFAALTGRRHLSTFVRYRHRYRILPKVYITTQILAGFGVRFFCKPDPYGMALDRE